MPARNGAAGREPGRDSGNGARAPLRPLLLIYPLLLIVVLTWVELPWHTRLAEALENAGHVPLFGILALVFLWTLPHRLAARFPGRRARYALVLVLTAALAVLTEGIQALFARDPSLADILRDMAGAAAFLGLHSVRAVPGAGWGRRIRFGIALGLLGAAFLPVLVWTAGYAARDLRFPVLLDSGSSLSRMFLDFEDATMTAIPAPIGWPDPQPSRVGRLVLQPAPHPGMVLREPVADWSGYNDLQVEVFVPDPAPLEITIRIDDRAHNGEYQDRYNQSFRLVPGPNRIRIPLARVRSAPRDRALDLQAIARVFLFAAGLRETRTLLIGRFTLQEERDLAGEKNPPPP